MRGFAVGQKVATFNFKGSHAELRAVPAATSWLVPDGLDIRAAAAVPAGPGTAAFALQLGGLARGQTVLVQGAAGAAGGVGVAAVQLAAQAGARVIGTGMRGQTPEQLRGYGLSDAIVTGGRPASEQIRELLGGNAVDLLIDNVGGPALADGLQVLKDGGRAVLVGVFGGRHQPIGAGHLLVHRQTAIGCLLGPSMGEPAIRAQIDDLLQRAARGELQVLIDSDLRAGASRGRAPPRRGTRPHRPRDHGSLTDLRPARPACAARRGPGRSRPSHKPAGPQILRRPPGRRASYGKVSPLPWPLFAAARAAGGRAAGGKPPNG